MSAFVVIFLVVLIWLMGFGFWCGRFGFWCGRLCWLWFRWIIRLFDDLCERLAVMHSIVVIVGGRLCRWLVDVWPVDPFGCVMVQTANQPSDIVFPFDSRYLVEPKSQMQSYCE